MPRLYLVLAAVLIMAGPSAAGAEEFSSAAYKGKVVYLDFWASWCTPCKLSFPWMNDLARTYAQQGLVVIAVNVDHDRAAASAFLHDTPASFPVIYDPDGKIAEQFKVKDMPTSVLIGRDGAVHYVHEGFTQSREGEYAGHVLALLRGTP
jgi:cytochrome c biogenesis protein CcmG, thiol:disulfide interchange protein DsbE